MRIKFEKGFTPERLAEVLVNYIREKDLIIGTVNVYLQTYNEDMKPEEYNNTEYLVCTPSPVSQSEYEEDVIRMRRKRIKVVNG